MHAAVLAWVHQWRGPIDETSRVLEFGSKNINGSVRDLFAGCASYLGIDIAAGPDVDLIADAATCEIEPGTWDVVVCAEVLEHTPDAAAIVANACRHLKPQGRFVMTCAGVGRAPHSAVDGAPIRDWEHYANVSADDLHDWLEAAGFASWQVDVLGADTRCVAWR